MTEDERAIRELIDSWLAATKAGDLQAVLSLMTEDVVFMVPGAAPFGRDAFAESFSAMAGVRLDGRSEIQELQILGDWAYLRNLINMIVSPPGGAAPVRRAVRQQRRAAPRSDRSGRPGRCPTCRAPGAATAPATPSAGPARPGARRRQRGHSHTGDGPRRQPGGVRGHCPQTEGASR